MDVLTFIGTLVQSLAWPAAVVVVALLFRRSLATLIPGLRRLKYKELEVEFERQLQEARQELRTLPPPPELPAPEQPETESVEPQDTIRYYRSLAEVSPRGAMLEAWLGFELAANAALELVAPSLRGQPLQMPQLFNVLQEADILKPTEVNVLTRLRALRNAIVHGPEPELSSEVIGEYASLVGGIANNLQERASRQRARGRSA